MKALIQKMKAGRLVLQDTCSPFLQQVSSEIPNSLKPLGVPDVFTVQSSHAVAT